MMYRHLPVELVCRLRPSCRASFTRSWVTTSPNELVEWFNMVDATYRSELRELNELNYARFEAKLEQRIAELRAELRAGFARLEARSDAQMEMRFGGVASRFSSIDVKLAQLETRLTKRMFAFWIAQAATTAALVFGVVKLVH